MEVLRSDFVSSDSIMNYTTDYPEDEWAERVWDDVDGLLVKKGLIGSRAR